MSKEVWYSLSSLKMTFAVATDASGFLVDVPPIARTFRGQPLDNLRRWMRKQGGFREHRMVDISQPQEFRDG